MALALATGPGCQPCLEAAASSATAQVHQAMGQRPFTAQTLRAAAANPSALSRADLRDAAVDVLARVQPGHDLVELAVGKTLTKRPKALELSRQPVWLLAMRTHQIALGRGGTGQRVTNNAIVPVSARTTVIVPTGTDPNLGDYSRFEHSWGNDDSSPEGFKLMGPALTPAGRYDPFLDHIPWRTDYLTTLAELLARGAV